MTYPPGTILQRMHLRRRLRGRTPGRFLEIGPGGGHVSEILLENGWSGVGYELSEESSNALRATFQREISDGRYEVVHGDWMQVEPPTGSFDLVISSMVLEHLDEDEEGRYVERCARILAPGGTGMLFVPSSPDHWGIEDVIAGHFRRYTRGLLTETLGRGRMTVLELTGLTFPLSNLLLPISNRLVRRAEHDRVALAPKQRTEASGHRHVTGKTHFPAVARLILNEWVLYPFDLLQRIFSNSRRAMVLFAEFRPKATGDPA